MKKRDNDYFAMLREGSSCCVSAARFVLNCMQKFDTQTLSADLSALHEIEHEGDVRKHDMLEKLSREFITPIEREDIINLAQQIDTVTDTVEDVLICLHTYNITALRPDAAELAGLIVQACEKLEEIMAEFCNYKKSRTLHPAIIELNRLEELGDSMYTAAVRALFEKETDPIRIVAWVRIYDMLENCLDACEDASEVVESVVMKNS